MDRIEKVKKILEDCLKDLTFVSPLDERTPQGAREEIKWDATHRIHQLFEPKPDKSRLLMKQERDKELLLTPEESREAVELDRPELTDTLLAILSFANYRSLGIEEHYVTPAESYTEEGMSDAMDTVNQILALIPSEEEVQHLKLKLPENPHMHTSHHNETFPCKACIWDKAIKQLKELNPDVEWEEK